eukprot:scaffold14705_cov56-Phaeocystis_antarctica.AAC.1
MVVVATAEAAAAAAAEEATEATEAAARMEATEAAAARAARAAAEQAAAQAGGWPRPRGRVVGDDAGPIATTAVPVEISGCCCAGRSGVQDPAAYAEKAVTVWVPVEPVGRAVRFVVRCPGGRGALHGVASRDDDVPHWWRGRRRGRRGQRGRQRAAGRVDTIHGAGSRAHLSDERVHTKGNWRRPADPAGGQGIGGNCCSPGASHSW